MNRFALRREELMKRLEDQSLVILFSGNQVMRSEDDAYPFDVNRNFYYFTGIEKEGMILVMRKLNGNVNSTLFILPFDELLAKWVGGRMKADEVESISDIKDVRDVNDFESYIASLDNFNRSFGGLNLYLDLWRYNAEQAPSEALKFANLINKRYPNAKINDIYAHIADLRTVKDEDELVHIQKAINITQKGIEAMMKNIRPNMNEMIMEGIFNFTLMQRGCNKNAFHTIAASGKRATVLHYSDNNNIMQDGELFLCDLGATHGLYCADISRTFPVNGKFTERQKAIYNTVLKAQEIVENNARPGVSIRELNQMVIDFYAVELPKLGLNKPVSEYYFHGIGHQLGLDTHDVSNSTKATKLEKGMVITNEPGLYIEDEAIGIRIEDDLYITENGCINLAKNIIKQVDDIENFMRH